MLQNFVNIFYVKVIFLALLLVLVYLVYKSIEKKYRERPMLISGMKDARVALELPRENITESRVGNEFSYLFWIKVDDWGHNFSKPKHILHIGDKSGNSVCPGIWLYPKNNNLMVRVDTHHRLSNINKTLGGKTCQNWISQYPHKHRFDPAKHPNKGLGDHNYCRDPDNYYKGKGSWCYTTDKHKRWEKCSDNAYDSPQSMNPSVNKDEIGENKKCDIVDIPIQRWIHIGVTLSNRTLDVYINGELSRSCTLENVPLKNGGDIFINQDGGFNGYISNLQYISHAVNESHIKGVYNKGANESESDVLDKYNSNVECKKPEN